VKRRVGLFVLTSAVVSLMSSTPRLSATTRAATDVSAGSFTLWFVDGRSTRAEALSIAPDGTVSFKSQPPDEIVRLDDLMQITTNSRVANGTLAGETVGRLPLWLADGGRLAGRLVSAADGTRGIVVDFGWTAPVLVPFEALAAIRFDPRESREAEQLLASRLERRDPVRDVMIVNAEGGPTAWPGAIEMLSERDWKFRFSGRLLTGTTDQLYALVFAGGAASPRSTAERNARIVLTHGGDFSATIRSADEEGIRCRSFFGADIDLTWSRISRIDIRSGRIRFLSDLNPIAAESRGFFGYSWPWRVDESLDGGPLRIGRHTFARGLAVHSYSRLEYLLRDGETPSQPFKQFAVTIGIDDSGAALGHVFFRVFGDGRTLFESPVRADDSPREILVTIDDVQRLVLEVDFGEGLDLGDRAVWANARLIR
jgi:hypothetical protein